MSSCVVVTGGAGFLGSHVCDRLIAIDHHVVCVDNFSTGVPDNVAHLLDDGRFDLLDVDVCGGLSIDRPVEAVLHLASPASPPAYQALAVETLLVGSVGTKAARDLAREHDAPFLLTSTSEVYGDPEVHPQPEEYRGNVSTTGPRAMYDESKRFAEALTVTYRDTNGVDVRIARIFNTYGPRLSPGDGRAVPNFIAQALSNRPLTVYGDGSQTRSFCYVDDMVDGILALLESDHQDPVNLGNPDERSILELARTIKEMTGSPSPIVFEPLPGDDPTVRCPDITKARSVLGWEPRVDLREGLRRTIEWARSLPHDQLVDQTG